MGVNGKRQKNGSKYRVLVNFCLKCFKFFLIFTEVWSKKQLWRKQVGVTELVSKWYRFLCWIVLPRKGYIEVQYTKIKSALVNRSSACVTAHAVAVHWYDYVGSSPAWILLLRASLLNKFKYVQEFCLLILLPLLLFLCFIAWSLYPVCISIWSIQSYLKNSAWSRIHQDWGHGLKARSAWRPRPEGLIDPRSCRGLKMWLEFIRTLIVTTKKKQFC